MKKILCSLLALFAIGIESHAQTISVAGDVEALSSGETVTVRLHIEGVTAMTSMHFEVGLPSGFSIANGTIGATSDWAATFSNEGGVAGAISSSNNAFTGEGDIASIPIIVPNGTSVGTYPITINNVRVNGDDIATTAQFNIVVVNVHSVVLDENATTAPEAATNVNVLVKRTIKANEWSTICLPFAMDATQVKAAFGDDVQLGDFTGYTPTFDGSNNVTAITVKFNEATAIAANHPYIIKVSSAITEFTADGVTINPEEAIVSFGETTGSGKNKTYHPADFIGTYVADFDFYEAANSYPLFLNANKFWYATPSTRHIMAFRAFFDFDDYLPEAEPAGAPIFISFNNDITGIKSIQRTAEDGKYYNLNGQRVVSPSKGLYIINGKKVVKK